jgi:hypothetical protein
LVAAARDSGDRDSSNRDAAQDRLRLRMRRGAAVASAVVGASILSVIIYQIGIRGHNLWYAVMAGVFTVGIVGFNLWSASNRSGGSYELRRGSRQST